MFSYLDITKIFKAPRSLFAVHRQGTDYSQMQTFLISKVVAWIFQLIRYELIKEGMNLCRGLARGGKITSLQFNVQFLWSGVEKI